MRVCRETRKSPLAVLSVCACAQSPGKEEPDPTPGEREEKFLCWSAATRRGCSEARGLEFEGFPGKICLRRHHQRTGSAARVCVSVCESAISGKQSGTPQGLQRLVKTPTPQKKIESTFVVFQQQSNLKPPSNLSKPWITSGSCNDAPAKNTGSRYRFPAKQQDATSSGLGTPRWPAMMVTRHHFTLG